MEAKTYRFTWQGIEIEAIYVPVYSRSFAHLEIRSLRPERAPLPITESGYRSHFHRRGTVEANGGDVVAQVIAWLDKEAADWDWERHAEESRQVSLF